MALAGGTVAANVAGLWALFRYMIVPTLERLERRLDDHLDAIAKNTERVAWILGRSGLDPPESIQDDRS